ncbi:hypothetical protein O3G_MSEX005448 [Manduca sexta]|nr:hypothetical protein O3G_MSEX005448 [Manduca sexta]
MVCPTEKIYKNKSSIQFAENTENTSSQKSSSYKEVLSQPDPGLSHRQKLFWLQKHRTLGIWVQCDDCERWRYLPNLLDSSELPHRWYCRMNTDKALADCSAPETPIHIREEEDLIHSVYSSGSVVWARLNGWPWWPAMVDDCPDVEQFYWLDGFSDIPTHYNVVFFDVHDVTRAWIAPEQLKPYNANKTISKHLLKLKKYRLRLEAAITQADDAVRLPLLDRLEKYSFLTRYKGHIASPKRVNQKDLLRYQKIFKRKFNVEFPIETSSDSEDEVDRRKPVINTKTAKNKKTRVENLSNKLCGVMKTRSIPKNETNRIKHNSEKSNNEPDSIAVLVGSDVNPSLTTTIGNDAKTNISEPKHAIESSQLPLLQDGNASPSSDDFDFL